MIPKEIIESIQDSTTVLDVVSERITLKKKGRLYVACCPFHNEKSPSFKVDNERGFYHCYGCGAHGDAIKFVQEYDRVDFPTAIRMLAEKCKIEIEDRKETPEETESRIRKEMLQTMMAKVAAVYEGVFKEDNEAQVYAYNRWGEQYCDDLHIGYAPTSGDYLVRWAQREGESLDVLNELGLVKIVKGVWRDFYHGRVMIPIHDRIGNIISFTARDITGVPGAPKYLNGSESLLFKKGEVLFGYHLAKRVASKQNKMYAVEGAPDCLRLQMIGVINTVAPLGTEWTEKHFRLLSRLTRRICFLPDIDPPREGEVLGTGILSVIKNGKEAMKSGFSVSVRQIPQGENGAKQDPDEYCKDMAHFKGLEERDFILWLAEMRFDRSKTMEDKAEVVEEISKLLLTVESDTKRSMLIDELSILSGKKPALWNGAVNRQKRLDNESKKPSEKGKREEVIENLKEYGFYERNGKYCSTSKEGEECDWSNFTMKPLFHILDSVMPKRLFMIKNEYGLNRLIELRQEEFTSLNRFKQKIEGLGNFIWMASDKELTRLKRYLYKATETAIEVKQLGWQKQGVYAFGNGIYDNNSFQKVDELGIVRVQGVENFYLPAFSKQYQLDDKFYKFERKFVYRDSSNVSLQEFTSQIFKVFGNNGKIGFCFLLATLFRDVVTAVSGSFPLLNLFGPKGSGKSELGHTLMSFFIAGNIPPSLRNSTLPALNETVAAVANALVHIDEFKNDIDVYKREFLKGLWDGTGRMRMNMDLDKKSETTSVKAGVILSGQEMATADIALFSRFIYLTFTKSDFTKSEVIEYNRLKDLRHNGVTHLTLQLLSLRKVMEMHFKEMYELTQREVNAALEDGRTEERIKNNWLIPLATLRTVEGRLPIGLYYDDILPVVLEGITRQNSECLSNNELAGFWQTIQYLLSEDEIYNEGDFQIRYLTKLKTESGVSEWPSGKRILLIQTSRLLKLYKKANKQTDETGLPEASLRYYLKQSKEYLGEKAAVRFKCFLKGGVPKVVEQGGKPVHMTQVQRAYCFDYDALAFGYRISLEVSALQSLDEEEDEK